MTTKTIDDAKIAEAAFYIWLDEGQPQGRDLEHWLKAQEALKPAKKATAKRKPAAKSADAPATKTKAPRKAKISA